jgi:protein O-GlcNAc transferase
VVKVSTSQALALAIEHLNAGQANLAESIARAVVQTSPDSADVHAQLGRIFFALQLPEDAERHSRMAAQLAPDRADLLHDLAVACESLNKLADAEESYRRALAIDPDSAPTHHNLGRLLASLRRLPEAEAAYRRALAIKPDLAESANNLGNVLLATGRAEAAVESFRQALQVQPQSADFSTNLGRALLALGLPEEAEAACRAATMWAPDNALAWSNLAGALQAPARSAEALAAHRRALELLPPKTPIESALRNNLAASLLTNGCSAEAEAEFRRANALAPDDSEMHSALLACSQYCDAATPEQLAGEHALWDIRFASSLQSTWTKYEPQRRGGRPMRLGFVSADLCEHPVGNFLVRTLECLDHSECWVVCYHDRRETDAVSERIRAAADNYVTSASLDHAALARRIQDEEIDILFDLSGHTVGNRLLTFARKPAPIQITWLGYEGTTGLSAMDYIVANRHTIRPGEDTWYRERVLRLPDTYVCFDPPAAAPDVSPLPALESGAVTFASFSNPAKLSDRTIQAWADILRRVAGSRLLLKYGPLADPANQQRFRGQFAAAGVDPQRIMFAGWTSHAETLAEYCRVDVALDPLPFSGSATTCDALWMGVPVVTCPGPTFATRHTTSHLETIGLASFVARDHAHYVDLAAAWASDLTRLAEVRARLRTQMADSPLCDGPRFARQFLDMLQTVWQQWLDGG